MLRVFYHLRDMDFEKLMAVYLEGNVENGQEFFPDDSPAVQLQKAKNGFEDYLREDFFQTNGSFYAVWEQEGEYVSALRMEPYEEGLLLEALETKPDRRRCGYAVKLMNEALGQLRAGTVVYSHVSKRNTASLAVHGRCGFQRIREHARYVDGTVTDRSCTLKYTKA